jgi:hypothetical protein
MGNTLFKEAEARVKYIKSPELSDEAAEVCS